MLGKDLNELIKNAEGIMEKAKERLSTFTAHGEAGAGLVKVKVNAKHQVIELKLDDEILKEAKEVVDNVPKVVKEGATKEG